MLEEAKALWAVVPLMMMMMMKGKHNVKHYLRSYKFSEQTW
jgi:hypothetical protein